MVTNTLSAFMTIMSDTPTILHQDEHLVAVHKPAGLKMHRSAGDGRRQRFLLQWVRDYTGRRVYPVHRLDRATSGIVLLGFDSLIAHALAESFRQRTIAKTYAAVVRGFLEPSGCIDYPLTADPGAPKAGQKTKSAVTCYERVATVELPFAVGRYATCRYTFTAVYPHTGRLHQIRRHFHHISHHLIGDTVYGDGRHNRFFRERFGCSRLMLAAVALNFPHPVTGAPCVLQAPLEASFERIVHDLGWQKTLPDLWRRMPAR